MAEQKEYKFPSEVIDLPSGGKVYPEDSPLRSGKLEIKYMTAKEEDILTSQNLIKKGVVIDMVLNSLIVTKGVTCDDLILGDKNAVMVAARILAYGPDYKAEWTNPQTNEKSMVEFDLSECPFKELPKNIDYTNNRFNFKLPASEQTVTFKLLTGWDDDQVTKELKSSLNNIHQREYPAVKVDIPNCLDLRIIL